MWTLLISFVTGIFKAWFGEHERTVESEKAGSATQALSTETQAMEKVDAAQVARDHVVDLTPGDVSNIKPGTDPDFRD